MYKTKHYNIDIWGDGEKEYLGYYMIIIDKFDINDNWISKNIVYTLWKEKMYSIVWYKGGIINV